MSRHQRPLQLRNWFGNNIAIGIAIRLVEQQDVRSTGSHDASGEDVNDANGTGSSDNNRQRCNARFVFSSFVKIVQLSLFNEIIMIETTAWYLMIQSTYIKFLVDTWF